MSYLDPATWRAATADEVIKSLPSTETLKREGKAKRPKRAHGDKQLPGLLVFRSLLNPLDVYTYLRARFGAPNGMQSMMIHKIGMVSEDSGNMIQWDYVLKAGERTFTITGAGREVHVMIDGDLSDEEWLQLASSMKADFAKYGPQKSAIVKELEKWHVFPNRFKSLADRCAELHSELGKVVEEIQAGLPYRPRGLNKRAGKEWGRRRGLLTNRLVTASVQLSILTPVMFESFIGLITAVMLRPGVRKNKRIAETYRRSPLDVKIYDLATRCAGFARPIEESNHVMRDYWAVVNERNDVIHGNVDPVNDALEIVYFDRKMPLYPKGGDALDEYFASLIKQYQPERVLRNYLLAHELIVEILNHMIPTAKKSIASLLDDSQPGWDDKRGILGFLFPDYVGTFYLPGTRYDTDLVPSTSSGL